MPTVNDDATNRHLAEISKGVAAGPIAALVIDGAGWYPYEHAHRVKQYRTADITPDAPELNPLENILEYLRGNAFGHQVYETYVAILEA